MEALYALSGFVVGALVGFTGVGGGSLMTPLLVLLFGVAPHTAVATDLLYASITKTGGAFVHARRGGVEWRTVAWLAAGSLPASVLTLAVLHGLALDGGALSATISSALGFALVLTAIALLFKERLLRLAARRPVPQARRPGASVIAGAFLGILVTLSSVGAGSLGTVALMFLFPALASQRIVGTDIAHAVPLTLVAGLGHAAGGAVNWPLLGSLLAGSLPGIYLGSSLSHAVPEKLLRTTLAAVLVLAGGKLIW